MRPDAVSEVRTGRQASDVVQLTEPLLITAEREPEFT